MRRLSICIPTYKRLSKAIELALFLRKHFNEKAVEILVVLDASDDVLTAEREQRLRFDKVNVIRHGKNLGYEAAFLSCLSYAKSEYVLICPDDDTLVPEAISELIQYINFSDEDIIVFDWIGISGKKMRNYSEITGLRLQDIRDAVNHATGIVYKRSDLIAKYELIRSNNSYSSLRFYYPQVFFALLVYLSGGSILTKNLVLGGYSKFGPEPSDLMDERGLSYCHPASSLSTWIDLIDFLQDSLNSFHVTASQKKELRQYIRHLKYLLFTSVYSSIESKESYNDSSVILGILRAFVSAFLNKLRR